MSRLAANAIYPTLTGSASLLATNRSFVSSGDIFCKKKVQPKRPFVYIQRDFRASCLSATLIIQGKAAGGGLSHTISS
jgi:hypothetical protein